MDFQHISETFRGDEGALDDLVLNDSVRGHSCSVNYLRYFTRVDGSFRNRPFDST